jgi:PBSX family phage terminase large subunit
MLDLLPMSRRQVESIWHSTARVNIWHGSIRSGKTIASLLRWLMYVAQAPMGGELVVVGRTRESIYRNLFSPLMDPSLFGPLAKLVHYTAGAPTGIILGRRVHVLGASDARAEAVLRGLTVSGAYVDEATLMAENFWVTLIGRMSVPGSQLFATTNPDSPGHWFKRTVVDRAAELGYYVTKFVLDDNKWLAESNPGYVAQIKREYVGLWYRRFILGDWVQADGAVFDMWDPARHVVPHDTLPVMSRILSVGVDYGTTNPTRGLLLGVGRKPRDRTRLYVLDEWAPRKGTDADLSRWLIDWRDSRQPEDWQHPDWIYVDPAAASFKLQLFRDGVRNSTDATNDVLPGIRTVASLLATDSLKVSDRCQKLITFLPGYAWDAKATDQGLDKPIKQDDHEVDALRYAVHSSAGSWRNDVPVDAARDDAAGVAEREAA